MAECDRDALQASVPLDEDAVWRVHQHVIDPWIVEQWLDTAEAEQVRAQPVELGVGKRRTRGAPDPLADEPTARGIAVQREQRRGIESRGHLASHARDELRVDHSRPRMRTSIARNVGARVANSSTARNGSRGMAASR